MAELRAPAPVTRGHDVTGGETRVTGGEAVVTSGEAVVTGGETGGAGSVVPVSRN